MICFYIIDVAICVTFFLGPDEDLSLGDHKTNQVSYIHTNGKIRK